MKLMSTVDLGLTIKLVNVLFKLMSIHFSIVLKHQDLALVKDLVQLLLQPLSLMHLRQDIIVYQVTLGILMLLQEKISIRVKITNLLEEVQVQLVNSKMIVSCPT